MPAQARPSTLAYAIKDLSSSTSESSGSEAGSPTFSSQLAFAHPGMRSASSPPSSPETDSHPSPDSPPAQYDEDEEADSVPAPLPSYTIRPKGIAERERERKLGSKKNTLAAAMARKRADSLKWSKYENMGSGVIELNMCQDELARRS